MYAQVSTIPDFIKTDNNSTFVVIFDASAGNGGMKDATTCYAHTGTLAPGASSSSWKHAPSWGDNSEKYKLTPTGEANKWQLEITGGIREYYGLAEGEEVDRLAFVFRTADSKSEGKTADGTDIILTLTPAQGLAMSITSPTQQQVVEKGSKVSFKALFSSEVDSAIYEVDYKVAGHKRVKYENVTSVEDEISSLDYGVHSFSVVAYLNEDTVCGEKRVFVYDKEHLTYQKMDVYSEGVRRVSASEYIFSLRAPNSGYAFLISDLSDGLISDDYLMNVDTESKPGERIFWTKVTIPDNNKFAYQYQVDGKSISDPYSTVVLDPWNDKYLKNIDPSLPEYPEWGNGIVSVFEMAYESLPENQYEWASDFTIKDKNNLLIYELHLRDFTAKQTLKAALDSLDYLKKLNINAIELMPVTEFDGNNSWGYNPNHFFAYDKAYGTREDYKEFIDSCHSNGIAVIIDMVFNHATGSHPYAKLYWDAANNRTAENNPWFNVVAKHPYNVYHDINHEYEGTRSYFKKVLEYWLTEYRVDGFRMDLTKGFTQHDYGESGQKGDWSSYDASRIAILKDYYSVVASVKPSAVFIMEHLGTYSEEKEYVDAGMMPWRNLNNNYLEASMGWAGSKTKFVDSDASYAGTGAFTYGWVSYPESHDEERMGYKNKMYGAGEMKDNESIRLLRVPLTMAFVALMPGPKMIWEFGELGYDYSINWCSDGTIGDCRTDPKPSAFTLKWMQDWQRVSAYTNTSNIFYLRRNFPQFFSYENVTEENCASTSWKAPRRLTITSADKDTVIMVLGNFSATDAVETAGNFPTTGEWYNYLKHEKYNVSSKEQTISLEPSEILILSNVDLAAPIVGVEEISAAAGVRVYPTVTSDVVFVESVSGVRRIEVVDMQGRIVMSCDGADSVNLGQLADGNYLILVLTEESSYVSKVIKR